MTSFCLLNHIVRSLFCTWTVILCIGFIVAGALAIIDKRKKLTVTAGLCFLLPFFIFQCCTEISARNLYNQASPLAGGITVLPWAFYFGALCLITVLDALLICLEIVYRKTHITPDSVKQAADGLDSGLMFYHATGQPFMVNHKMNGLSIMLTGEPLLDGNNFVYALDNRDVIELGGRYYRFTHFSFSLDGEEIREIVAEDITELYKKSQRLQAENEKLSLSNKLMKEYGGKVDETVRREEILKTKASVHDEMNHLLLATDKAIHSDSPEERQSVIRTWQKNIVLLSMEADSGENENPLADIDELARLLGVTVHYSSVPQTVNPEILRLFVFAAEEALTNAVKHAEAKNFYIDITEKDGLLTTDFSNDGILPAGKINESGGLKNLRERLDKICGTMIITAENKYNLRIIIPGGKNSYGL